MACLCRIASFPVKLILTSVYLAPTVETMIEETLSVRMAWKPFQIVQKQRKISTIEAKKLENPFDSKVGIPIECKTEETLLLADFNRGKNVTGNLPIRANAMVKKIVGRPSVTRVMFTKKYDWNVDVNTLHWCSKDCAVEKIFPFCKQLLYSCLYWSGRSKPWTNLKHQVSSVYTRPSPR
jgi:hypothetical protein